jgi:DNA-binding transcriptional LysR family regulator
MNVGAMRLRSVDLNLLVALEALLEERHVSRAALRVGLSQPAMRDLVAVMPERLADVLARAADGFARRDQPVAETAFEWALYWHRRQEGSAQHAWLHGAVAEAVRSSDAKPGSGLTTAASR